MTQAIQNVSDTAFMVAGFRALENERGRFLADVSAQANEAFRRLCGSDPEMIDWLGTPKRP
jgi:hypothetical protein